MAKQRGDDEQQEPTLELPSLFGRGRKRRRARTDESADEHPAVAEEPPVEEPRQSASPPPVAEDPLSAPPPVAEAPPAEHVMVPLTVPTEPRRRATPADTSPEQNGVPRPVQQARLARAARTTPLLPAPVAAVLTGLLVGLAGTALTYVSLRGCEMLQGTESCGAPGLGLLVVIIVLMMLGGALLLKLLGVADPRGTSFLAVGLMCVVVLVTLMEDLFSAWMFVAVPLICAASYALARWVTTQFVETTDDRPHVDVR